MRTEDPISRNPKAIEEHFPATPRFGTAHAFVSQSFSSGRAAWRVGDLSGGAGNSVARDQGSDRLGLSSSNPFIGPRKRGSLSTGLVPAIEEEGN